MSIADLLNHSGHLWLAANRPDGAPHVTPMWFVYIDGTVWCSITKRSRKARLLAADPRVSFSAEGTAEAGGLVGESVATLVEVGERPGVIAAFGTKYGWDAADAAPEGERALVRVEVARWLQVPRE
ncbi:pyridoxamine 5'-phosphate oxidase family protein [Gryllotalpicola reticulitermitis]|uniref:Pyridoxamine 5'-phosphate oxidase family protein n=1 Tax=Gryllotalpicola reticulitermitis TaxID=1184153 RepID=A0ABV8Q5I0_9MICO